MVSKRIFSGQGHRVITVELGILAPEAEADFSLASDEGAVAPAGRNIYSHGITKPEAPSERHGNEYAAPLGLFGVCVGGYNDVAPELKNDSSAAPTAALIQQRCSPILSPLVLPGTMCMRKFSRKTAPLWLLLLPLAATWMGFGMTGTAADKLPPAPTRYFNDYAHVVSPAVADELNRKLEAFEKSDSSQVVVAVYPKMESASSIEDYANRLYRAWQIGQKEKNNGALLLVFTQDRRLRIEVGSGLEGALPDALAKRIIEDEITPRFKAGQYEAGLAAGVNAILQAVRGEYKGTGRTATGRRANRGFGMLPFLIPILLVFFIARIRRAMTRGTVYSGGGRRGWYASPGWGGWTSGGGGGGGWSGGGGGGGGGGFSGGGGSSSGGGASGSW